jgi:hypothetical protein
MTRMSGCGGLGRVTNSTMFSLEKGKRFTVEKKKRKNVLEEMY